MKIGDLSRRTETSIATIRYYERLGLLPPPERASGCHRIYSMTDVERLAFIRRCRKLGFALQDVAALARIAKGAAPSADCREIVRRRLAAVRSEIAELRSVEVRLAELMAEPPDTRTCPRLAALN